MISVCLPSDALLQHLPSYLGFSYLGFLFTLVGQNIGGSISVSVLPMNIHVWYPLGWLGGSPRSLRDSQESCPTPQLKTINSSSLTILYGANVISIHDNWKNNSFDYTEIFNKVMSLILQNVYRYVIIFSSKEQASFKFTAALIISSDFGAPKNKVSHCFHWFPHLFAMKWWDQMPWSSFSECEV